MLSLFFFLSMAGLIFATRRLWVNLFVCSFSSGYKERERFCVLSKSAIYCLLTWLSVFLHAFLLCFFLKQCMLLFCQILHILHIIKNKKTLLRHDLTNIKWIFLKTDGVFVHFILFIWSADLHYFNDPELWSHTNCSLYLTHARLTVYSGSLENYHSLFVHLWLQCYIKHCGLWTFVTNNFLLCISY